MYPVSGGFYTLSERFIDSGFAFAMGWNYVLQWIVILPLEVTVAATTVQYWGDAVPVAALITIFWVVISKCLWILIYRHTLTSRSHYLFIRYPRLR